MELGSKTKFVIANKGLLAKAPTNKTINAMDESSIDTLVAEIKANPAFSEPETVAVKPVTSAPAVVSSVEFGELLELPYVGRSRRGFKFAYGDTFCYCNDSRLFAIESKLEVGTIMPFKADSLETLPYGGFAVRLNYSASEIISAVNAQIESLQSNIETEIKKRMLLLGVSRKQAETDVHNLYTADMDAKFKSSIPKVDLF